MGTRLSLRPLSHEGIADRITSGATRREIAMSYPIAGRIYRKQLTRIGLPTFPCPIPLFATLRRFSQRAPPDNLSLFH
jgi:hypothetical protein